MVTTRFPDSKFLTFNIHPPVCTYGRSRHFPVLVHDTGTAIPNGNDFTKITNSTLFEAIHTTNYAENLEALGFSYS